MSDGPFAGRASGTSLLSLTRAQGAALAAAGVVAVAWLADPAHPWVLVLAVPAVSALAVGGDRRSVADRLATVIAYLARSRWTYVSVVVEPDEWIVTARGRASCTPWLFEHVGRWDLSGRDADVGADLAGLLDELAAEESRHVSWHLLGALDSPVTILCTPTGTTAPRGAEPAPADAVTAALAGCVNQGWLYERWRYVRSAHGVAAVFALRSTPSAAARVPLGSLGPVGSGRTVSVHVRVVAARTARAAVGRHAHRMRADLALASVAGFRRRASADAATLALDERERDVAAGRALARCAVFVVVTARTPRLLDHAAALLRADARRIGASLERGQGRHAEWLCASVPGGPAWRS